MMVLIRVGGSGIGERGEGWFEIDLDLTQLGDRLEWQVYEKEMPRMTSGFWFEELSS